MSASGYISGPPLDALSDVTTSGAAAGEVLTYDGAQWEPEPGGGGGGSSTIAVGTTTTGAPGTNASVVNSGTPTDAVLEFTIPRGATGAAGTNGTNGTNGAPGAPGADGADGAPGPPGPSVPVVVRQAYITNLGRITLPDTAGAWLPLAGFPTLSIPAVVGDYIDVTMQALKNPPAAKIDVAVLAGGVPVRYMTSGGATPGFDGDAGWQYGGDFLGRPSPHGFVVQAGDLTAGNVVLCLAVNAAGVGTIDAQAVYPFYWRAMNFGATS